MKSDVKKRMFNQFSKIKVMPAVFFHKVFYIRKINYFKICHYFEAPKTIQFIRNCDTDLPAVNVFRDSRFDGPGN